MSGTVQTTPIIGRARVSWNGEAHDAAISIDLAAHRIHVRYRTPDVNDPAKAFQMFADGTPDNIALTAVEIDTASGRLSAPKLGPFFSIDRQFRPFNAAEDDAALSGTGLVHLHLMAQSSILEFNATASAENELVYVGHSTKIHPRTFEIDGTQYSISNDGARHDLAGATPYVRISSTADLFGVERRIRLAWSLLFGIRMNLLVGCVSDRVRINLTDFATYQSSHRLYEPVLWSGEMFECLLTFLFKLSDADLDFWYRAGAFFIEGKSARVELDIRVVNLLVFLEMIDDTDTLDAKSISKKLDISYSDAKLVKEVRNRLMHGKLSLNPSLKEADAHLRVHDPNYALQHFDLSEKRHPMGLTFTARLWERINRYVCQQMSWTKGYNDYSYILT